MAKVFSPSKLTDIITKKNPKLEQNFSRVHAVLPDPAIAEDIAEALAMKRLIATAQVFGEVPTIRASRKHDIKKVKQATLVMVTTTSKVNEVISYIVMRCPNEDSKINITSTKIDESNSLFLEWVAVTTAEADTRRSPASDS